jgi:hypothetical protein
MGAKAEVGWTRRTEEGIKLDVYAQRVGGEWRFFRRQKRYDKWQPIPHPPMEDWMELLDAVHRMITRRRLRPEEEDRVKSRILELHPGTKFD